MSAPSWTPIPMTSNPNCPLASRRRILLVDDTPSNLHLLARALTSTYEVMVATSGPSALALLEREGRPDLILLDIMMPGMDGYEVCRQLKGRPETSSIPLIFVTAKDSKDDQQRGYDLGAAGYIPKPVEIPLVLAQVTVLLGPLQA